MSELYILRVMEPNEDSQEYPPVLGSPDMLLLVQTPRRERHCRVLEAPIYTLRSEDPITGRSERLRTNEMDFAVLDRLLRT